MGARHHRWDSEQNLPAVEFGEEAVGMVIPRPAFVLRGLQRRSALAAAFPGAIEWNGSKDNNIAFDPQDKGPGRPYHVVRDETDPDPDRRYKGLLSARNRYPAVSPDGFHWTLLDTPPIPSQDESQFTHDHQSNQFLAMVKQGTEWGRSVWLSTSADFKAFSEPKLIFHTDEIDRKNRRRRVRQVIENPAYITPPIIDDEDYIAECYNMAVLPYQGFYIGFPTIFNPFGAVPPPATNYTRINQIELTVSRDLYHWERVADRALFIGLEPFDGENYGCSQLLMAGHPIVREDGEIWCYYNALRIPASIERYREFNRAKELFRLNVRPEHFEDAGALTLAKLRFLCSVASRPTRVPSQVRSPPFGCRPVPASNSGGVSGL